ncbi:Dyp-type peroxidase domain-containing protein [Streptomyces filamentosus]|uniref:Dyp-type peroxidase domain-containing protein n=1 Tax=Streptomyces filamentosus TaxID=67294 RepID=UPI001238677A|nr:Dyp-type peroxidase domain-containing protein [Streptomyces filamentosus]KAA6215583.1 hypothetical protein CP979_00225 [Streptomyces filamentosus]
MLEEHGLDREELAPDHELVGLPQHPSGRIRQQVFRPASTRLCFLPGAPWSMVTVSAAKNVRVAPRCPVASLVARPAVWWVVPDRCHPPPLLRRSYAYDGGPDDRGLLFSCFQGDPAAGFETVQRCLAGEAMTQCQLTVGDGCFFVPPPGDARPAWADPPGLLGLPGLPCRSAPVTGSRAPVRTRVPVRARLQAGDGRTAACASPVPPVFPADC